ncbi:MAG TPA: hypothetical protein VNP92_23435 [Actinophytocola sp.]|nr:hypothetical protein [Actinophytocola sp.]
MGTGETVVADSTATRVVTWLSLPVGCAALAWLLKLAIGWLVTLPWVPYRGLLELIDSIPEPWGTVGSLTVGLVAGLVLGGIGAHESLTVSVADERVTLESFGRVATHEHADVATVFLDRKQLVLLGADTAELDRRPCELDRERVAAAFRAHGYPWADADPHADAYRRWVPDTPDLPTGANALLTARQKALGKTDSTNARELRSELARIGVVVRDDKRKQYWRLSAQEDG